MAASAEPRRGDRSIVNDIVLGINSSIDRDVAAYNSLKAKVTRVVAELGYPVFLPLALGTLTLACTAPFLLPLAAILTSTAVVLVAALVVQALNRNGWLVRYAAPFKATPIEVDPRCTSAECDEIARQLVERVRVTRLPLEASHFLTDMISLYSSRASELHLEETRRRVDQEIAAAASEDLSLLQKNFMAISDRFQVVLQDCIKLTKSIFKPVRNTPRANTDLRDTIRALVQAIESVQKPSPTLRDRIAVIEEFIESARAVLALQPSSEDNPVVRARIARYCAYLESRCQLLATQSA